MSQRFPPANVTVSGPPGTPQPRYQPPQPNPGLRNYGGSSNFPVSNFLFFWMTFIK